MHYYTATITNLKSNGIATFSFRNPAELDKFVTDIKLATYVSRKQHIRFELPLDSKTIETFIIYTANNDQERIVTKSI